MLGSNANRLVIARQWITHISDKPIANLSVIACIVFILALSLLFLILDSKLFANHLQIILSEISLLSRQFVIF